MNLRPKRKQLSPEDMVEDIDEPLPYSPSAEMAMLSSYLQSPLLLEGKETRVETDAFHHPANKTIYEEMLAFKDKSAIDLITLTERLTDLGLIKHVGGESFLTQLFTVVAPSSGGYYRTILNDKLRRRRIILASSEMIRSSRSIFDEEFEPSIKSKTSAIDSLFKDEEKEKPWMQVVKDCQSEWAQCYSGKKLLIIPSPWKTWNNYLGGIPKGYTLVLGKRKMGKSSLVGCIAAHRSIELGERSLIFTYETIVNHCIMRMASGISGVEGRYFFQPDFHKPSESQVKRMNEAMDKIAKAPIRIVSGNGMGTREIRQEVRKYRPSLAAIDYLMLLPKAERVQVKEGTEAIIRANSNDILDMSRNDMDGTIMVLNHIAETGDRAGESRWSSAPENDADLTTVVGDEGILIKSQRNGPYGEMLPIKFDGRFYKFNESTTQPKKEESEYPY